MNSLLAACHEFLDRRRNSTALTAATEHENIAADSDNNRDASGQRPKLVARDSVVSINNPVISTLPLEDEDFREIALEFVPQLEKNLIAMDKAVDEGDFAELATLAHWLKGAGGTCGYNDFYQPCVQLEEVAKVNDANGAVQHLDQLWDIASRIVVPVPSA